MALLPSSHYDLLNVSPSATLREVKRAYKRLMKRYHPDNIKNESDKNKAKLINKAYEVLKDPELRCTYDMEIGLSTSKMSRGESLAISEAAQHSRASRELSILTESAAHSRSIEERVLTTTREGTRQKGGGLMIVKALFGSVHRNCDVTKSVQCLVEHRGGDGGCIKINEGLDKRTLTGLVYPLSVHEREIILDVEYMFDLILHKVRVGNFEALMMPLEEHAIDISKSPHKKAIILPAVEPDAELVKFVEPSSIPNSSSTKTMIILFAISCFLVYWWTDRKEEQTDKKLEESL